jgi:hypothetical protein
MPQRIPDRIIQVAKRLTPPPRWDDAVWCRSVEAEILPEYRNDFPSPFYDDWMELLLRSIHPAHGVTIHLLMKLWTLKKRIVECPDFTHSPALHSLMREIYHRERQWNTENMLTLLDQPPSPFARKLFHDVKPRPGKRRGQTLKPVDYDRLPQTLRDFAMEVIPRPSRLSTLLRALQEHVYPHFQESALDIEPYREFLALAIRHYGAGETKQLRPLVETLIERLATGQEEIDAGDARRSRIDATLLQQKCEDLLGSIKRGLGPDRGPAH